MKKTLLTLGLIGSSLLLGSCAVVGVKGEVDSNNPSKITVNHEKTMAYQAISSLESMNFNMSKAMPKFLDNNTEETTEKKDDIKSILEQIDLVLNTNKDELNIEILESDKEEYETKQLVHYVDVDLEKKDLTLYYNSVTETEEEVEKDEEDEKESKETEVTTKLEGLLIKDEKEFLFDSEKESETEVEGEESEQEQELVMNIYLTEDKKSLVRCIQELETEIEDNKEETEEKYSYEKIVDSKRVSFYSFTREVEEDETEIKLVKDNKTYKIKMYEEDKKTYVRVALKDGKAEKQVTLYEKVINEETNEVSYVEVSDAK